jgi:hypothetical protein
VASAIASWDPRAVSKVSETPAGVDPRDAIVDIAFNQGANPERGFELILSEYGTCRAITVFEHQFPYKGELRESCGGRLVRHLYGELLRGLRHDLDRRGIGGGEAGASADQAKSVRSVVEEHGEIFADRGYHIDISHLQSVIRCAAGLKGQAELELAIKLCDYGRRLARDFQAHDRPPFEDFYNDYRIFLRALAGEGVDGALRYFRAKAERAEVDDSGQHFPGEVYVFLCHRTGRQDEAAAAHLKYLKNMQGRTTLAPSMAEICEAAGDFASLLKSSLEQGDLLQYSAALVRRSKLEAGGSAGD